jgi:ribosomal protein S27AE
MWQCDNCGYTDEEGVTFDEETSEENPAETVRYCPECGSDDVFLVEDMDEDDEEEEDEFFADDGKEYADEEDAIWGDDPEPKGNGSDDHE